uniref:Activin_recp domain-containing protein n=1 Tax=Rhabditophanes sp. KR3021 TaxID=114890 RepID=A0AC35TTA9_9BILA
MKGTPTIFNILFIVSLTSLPTIFSIQCYSGSQLQMIECPSMSCIKQTLGLDTVRYCDGTGVSSICTTYQIFDSCSNIPNLGYICCCGSNLCNDSAKLGYNLLSMALLLLFAYIII